MSSDSPISRMRAVAQGRPENPAGRRSQRERQRAETRERVFEAALEEFKAVGFAAAQIPSIAAAAGVVRGTFYFHFPSKEHVLLELLHRLEGEVADGLDTLRDQPASVRQVVSRLIDVLLELSERFEDTGLLRDMLSIYVRGPADSDEGGESAVLAELTHHFVRAAESGELRVDLSPEQLSGVMLTSLFGLIVGRRDHLERDELERLMDVMLTGMTNARQSG